MPNVPSSPDVLSLLPALASSAAAFVVGGVFSYFRPYIEAEKDIRSRANLKKNQLVESLAMKMAALLQHLKAIVGTDDVLRGDGRESPDLVGDFVQETFRLVGIAHRLEVIKRTVRGAYLGLLLSTVAGIVGVFLAVFFPGVRKPVLIGALVVVALEIVMILVLFFASRRLETYEETA